MNIILTFDYDSAHLAAKAGTSQKHRERKQYGEYWLEMEMGIRGIC